jgi:hypothetical protein
MCTHTHICVHKHWNLGVMKDCRGEGTESMVSVSKSDEK